MHSFVPAIIIARFPIAIIFHVTFVCWIEGTHWYCCIVVSVFQ